MKVGVGLLNAPTVANSWKNLVNPSWVGMVDPAGRWATQFIWQRCENPLLFRESIGRHPKDLLFQQEPLKTRGWFAIIP